MDKVIKNFQNISYGPAPEDSKEVNSWIKNLKNPNNHFINGKFVKSSNSKKLNIINHLTACHQPLQFALVDNSFYL